MRASAVLSALVLLTSGCLDFSVERYCGRFPDLCSFHVDSVSPLRIPTGGGEEMTISGFGFTDPVEVIAGGNPVVGATLVDAETITFTAPGGPAGCVDLVVRSGGGERVLNCAYAHFLPLTVESVTPSPITSSGEHVFIRGSGLAFATFAAEGRPVQRTNPHEMADLAIVLIHSGPAGPFTLRISSASGETTVPMVAERPWSDPVPIETPPAVSAVSVAMDEANPGGAYVVTTTRALLHFDPQLRVWSDQPAPPQGGGGFRLVSAPDGTLFSFGAALEERLPGATSWTPVTDVANVRDVHVHDDGTWLVGATEILNRATAERISCPAQGCQMACRGAGRWYAIASSGSLNSDLFELTAEGWLSVARYPKSVLCQPSYVYVELSDGWNRVNPAAPEGSVRPIVLPPRQTLKGAGDVLFTLRSGALFSSRDHGESWHQFPLLPPLLESFAASRDGQRIVASPKEGPILMGPPGGTTIAEAGLPLRSRLLSLQVSPANATHLYARTLGRLARSTDGAQTWKWLPSSEFELPTRVAFSLTHPSRLYVGTRSGVRRSEDGGDTWALMSLNEPVEDLSVSPTDADDLLVATPSGVFRSRDGGGEWTLLPPPQGKVAANCVQHAGPLHPTRLFGCYDSALFWSNDAAGWTVPPGAPSAWSITASPWGDALLLRGTELSEFTSTGGDAWHHNGAAGVSFAQGPGSPTWFWGYDGRGWIDRLSLGSTEGTPLSVPGSILAIAAVTEREGYICVEGSGTMHTRVGGR